MGTIVVSTNMSLDGVVEDPDGSEGLGHGAWFRDAGGEDLEPWSEMLFAQARGTSALLLGRRSDEWFGTRWNARPGPWAARLNAIPKYVVSSTLADPVWMNGIVLSGDVVTEVTRLKRSLNGDICVLGSYQLARLLIEHDLVDELRLFVFPVVLGRGERLFGATTDRKPWRLVANETVGKGLTHATYEAVRLAT